MVVHARVVGMPSGPGGCRAQASCRITAGVELPRGQGEADGKQQQGGNQAGPGPGQPANLAPAQSGVLSRGWGRGTTKSPERTQGIFPKRSGLPCERSTRLPSRRASWHSVDETGGLEGAWGSTTAREESGGGGEAGEAGLSWAGGRPGVGWLA